MIAFRLLSLRTSARNAIFIKVGLLMVENYTWLACKFAVRDTLLLDARRNGLSLAKLTIFCSGGGMSEFIFNALQTQKSCTGTAS
jgi:hypothetical protein